MQAQLKVFVYGKLRGQKYLKTHPVSILSVVKNQADLWNAEYPDTKLEVQTASEFPAPGQRLSESGELVSLSTLERIQAGEIEIGSGQKVNEEGQIVPKSDLELLKAGLLSLADFRQQRLAEFHSRYNQHIQAFVSAYPAQRREGWATLVQEAREWTNLVASLAELSAEDRAAQLLAGADVFPQLYYESNAEIEGMTTLAERVLLKRQIYGAFSGASNRALDQAIAALLAITESQPIDAFYAAIMAVELSLPPFPEVENG
jgi:hypothetical protein